MENVCVSCKKYLEEDKTKSKEELLSLASFHGHFNCVETLIKSGVEVNTEPVLYVALQEGHYKCVQLLIQAGADVNTVHNEGVDITNEVRPILLFAAKRKNKDCAELLLRAAVDVHVCYSRNQKTTLMYAARNGWGDFMDSLIKAGADVNAKNKDSVTSSSPRCSRWP